MNTPDTEWVNSYRKKFRNSFIDGMSHEAVEIFITNLLTSRDTYWKERVRKAQAITYMRGYRSGYSDGDGQRRYDDIPDESELDTLLDNLN